MKYVLSFSFLVLVYSFSASAASNKICFGLNDAKGNNFVLSLTARSAVVSEATGELNDWLNGNYPRSGEVQGRDGKTYIDYNLGSNDGANDLLANKDLLKAGTKGYVKIRNRGEGFFESSYFCRDNR